MCIVQRQELEPKREATILTPSQISPHFENRHELTKLITKLNSDEQLT